MPRDVMVPFAFNGGGRQHVPVRNVHEYVSVVESHAPHNDVWVGLRPSTLYNVPFNDRAYCDIDDKDIGKAWTAARRLFEVLERMFLVTPEVFFSAGKGFHQHFEHDTVFGPAPLYGDAVLSVLTESGVEVDPQPLRNGRSMPRVPYSLNVKSLAKGEARYVVPVDITWDVEDVLRASREVWARPVKVPKSPNLPEVIQPLVDKALEDRRRSPFTEKRKSDLIQNAIRFTEQTGWRYKEGRRRILTLLYVPALVHDTDGDREAVLARSKAWVERSGGEWRNYERTVHNVLERLRRAEKGTLLPMGLKKFLATNPDIPLSGNSPK